MRMYVSNEQWMEGNNSGVFHVNTAIKIDNGKSIVHCTLYIANDNMSDGDE